MHKQLFVYGLLEVFYSNYHFIEKSCIVSGCSLFHLDLQNQFIYIGNIDWYQTAYSFNPTSMITNKLLIKCQDALYFACVTSLEPVLSIISESLEGCCWFRHAISQKKRCFKTTKYTIKILTSDCYRCHPVFILVLPGNNWCSNNIEPRLECLVQPQHNLISTIINIPQKAQNICNISCDARVTFHFYKYKDTTLVHLYLTKHINWGVSINVCT